MSDSDYLIILLGSFAVEILFDGTSGTSAVYFI